MSDMNKKITKILLGIGCLLFLLFVFLLAQYYVDTRKIHEKSQNIFDEMYYDVSLSSTDIFVVSGSRLSKMNGLTTHYRNKQTKGITVPTYLPNVKYDYQKRFLDQEQQSTVRMSFYYPPNTTYNEGMVEFSTNRLLGTKDYRITINYYYDVEKKYLVKSFIVYDFSTENVLYTETDESAITTILAKYKLAVSDVYDYSDIILEKYFLKK